MNDKQILHRVTQVEGQAHADYLFFCPGCKCGHGVWTTKANGHTGAVWKFNGIMEKPSFEPSLKITYTRDITEDEHKRIMAGEKLNIPQSVCHSVITDGMIAFCADSTHELAGKTVPMEPF